MAALSQRVRELLNRASQAESLTEVLFNASGAWLLSIGAVLIEGTFTLSDIILKPAAALGNALADITIAIFGTPAKIVIAGAMETIEALGGVFGLGPFAFPFAVGIVLLTFFLVQAFRAEESTANVIIGSGIDIPTPGVEDPEEEEGD